MEKPSREKIKATQIFTLTLVLFLASSAKGETPAEVTTPSKTATITQTEKQTETIPFGKIHITYKMSDWKYFRPEFLKLKKMSVFEAQNLKEVHGYLHTDAAVTESPNLDELCKQLVADPLDPKKPTNARSTVVKLSDLDACRVTKSTDDQNAIQYVFISKHIDKRGPSAVKNTRYFTNYLYFYYPKKSSADAEPIITNLVNGIESKK